MTRCSLWGMLLVAVLLLLAGCTKAENGADARGDVAPPSAKDSAPPTAPPAAVPAGPVGDDAEASLREIGKRATTAMADFRQPQTLLYPSGYYRRGFAPSDTSVELVGAEENAEMPRGVVHITYRELFSTVHDTEEAAAADDELYPRTPKAPLDSMLDDQTNPPLPEMTLEIDYEARDGQWYRVDWRGKARVIRGADLLDVIGIP